MKFLKEVKIKGKTLRLPAYFPDATRGVVRSLDSIDLKNAGVEGVVTNTYHLLTNPGAETINSFKGVKDFMNWDGFVTTDSGGWQIFSMVLKNKALGKISEDGVEFYVESTGKKTKVLFSPEMSVQFQFRLNPDIIVCLDSFTPPNLSDEEVASSVGRTTRWAKRCKEEFERLCLTHNVKQDQRPFLLAPIQGGNNLKLREKSANELINIGFDAYGLGGWLIDKDGKMDMELTKFIANLIPDNYIKFALGAGTPWDIVNSFKLGWNIFDCVLPTRDARHKRLYVMKEPEDNKDFLDDPRKFYSYIYAGKEVNKSNNGPISAGCDCFTCQNYSLSYIRHLFTIKEPLAFRLSSIHNLRVYAKTIELLRSIDYY